MSPRGYKRYVSVAEKKEKIRKSLIKLKKKDPSIQPIEIIGRKIAKTWWGDMWNRNLENYSDYYNRIERGSAYLKQGAVLDLKINKGKVFALVQGSRVKPYEVYIEIEPLTKQNRERVLKKCENKIDSFQQLIEGDFPDDLSEIFTLKGKGLFPTSDEIKFYCSCPDIAYMCKHVAAVLYGIGARFDIDAKLFFLLRDIKIDDIIKKAVIKESKSLIEKSKKDSVRIIKDTDIKDLFNIDI